MVVTVPTSIRLKQTNICLFAKISFKRCLCLDKNQVRKCAVSYRVYKVCVVVILLLMIYIQT